MTITYDGTNILDNIQKTRLVQHESVADFNINTLKPSRADGTIFIDEFIDTKEIVIEGIIQGTSQDNLEQNIDTFNELMNRRNKNLDISYAGGTRRYVCIPQEIKYNRDYFHLLFVPFRVVMLVPEGIGKNTSVTTLTAKTLTAVTTTETITFEGSANPKPTIRVLVNTRGNADLVRIENTDNSEYIDVELNGLSGTDYIDIDFENFTVLKNGVTEVIYKGKFPKIKAGSNNMKYTVYGSGYTMDQEQTITGSSIAAFYDNPTYTNLPFQAQSFIPSISGRIKKIVLPMIRVGSPSGYFYLQIREDDNNYPGDIISAGDIKIATTSIPTSQGYVEFYGSAPLPYLTAGKKYWLEANPAPMSGDDASNYIGWFYSNSPENYLKGKAMAKKNNTATYYDGTANAQTSDGVNEGQFDMSFYIYTGDGDSPDFNLSIQSKYTKKYL